MDAFIIMDRIKEYLAYNDCPLVFVLLTSLKHSSEPVPKLHELSERRIDTLVDELLEGCPSLLV